MGGYTRDACVIGICQEHNKTFQYIIDKSKMESNYDDDKPFRKINMDGTPLLKILRQMPKGALLHAHFPAMVDWRALLNNLISDPSLKDQIYYLSDASVVPNKTSFGKDAVWNAPYNAAPLPNTLTVFPRFPEGKAPLGWSRLTQPAADIIGNILSSSTSWPELEHNTELTWSLIKHEGVF